MELYEGGLLKNSYKELEIPNQAPLGDYLRKLNEREKQFMVIISLLLNIAKQQKQKIDDSQEESRITILAQPVEEEAQLRARIAQLESRWCTVL